MKQVVQNARSGEIELVEVPVPRPQRGQVLVRNRYSVVSSGTEKLALAFAQSSLFRKARSRPDLVQQVTRKLRQDGIVSTYRTVTGRLDAPQALGYSCAGIVEAIGESVTRFSPGDLVACAGAGYATHAEFVVVPENLAVHVPEGVSLDRAAFATLGAIALQGLRIAAPTLGETAAVVGLGLIGQIGVQLLRANGCRVLGLDLDEARLEEAREQGAEWAYRPDALPSDWKSLHTEGLGVDFALLTASSSSPAPLALAADLCRPKGRVVLVGAVPIEIDRRLLYEKELELKMSMSYGPGRYDRSYEELGLDYPLPYVRWTEQRNLQAFLELVRAGSLQPSWLRTQTRPFDEAVRCYEELAEGAHGRLAVVFEYPADALAEVRTVPVMDPRPGKQRDEIGVAFIGAGNYARDVLLPIVRRAPRLHRAFMVTATGASALRTAQKFRFDVCGTDPEAPIHDPCVDLVFVATRHDTHAPITARALRCGKAVWLEKPVALDSEQLAEVEKALVESRGFLAVGYNRRFSPHTRAVEKHLAAAEGPRAIHYTVAAGLTPRNSWITDPSEGGGRVVGEMCHFVDLCNHLVRGTPEQVYARWLSPDPEVDDALVAVLTYPDGSVATIEYLTSTGSDIPKERFEASAGGRTARCHNFQTTRLSGRKRFRTFGQDKGQRDAVHAVLDAVRGGRPSPFSPADILGVPRVTFAIRESASVGEPVAVAPV